MDETDLRIARILFSYSRTPYRTISDKLNLSLNAVHKRVKNLINQNIINEFTAKPSLYALKADTVFIFGQSLTDDLNKNCNELHDNNTTIVMLAGGRYVYVIGELKQLDELKEYTTTITSKLELKEPTIAILDQHHAQEDLEFSRTDLRIIKSLSSNSRKSLIDIAEDTDLSPKTIRKIMKRLQEKEMIDFSINWSPNVEGSVTAFFHISLEQEQNKKEVYANLVGTFPNITHCHSFVDNPRLILAGTWFKSLKEMKEFEEELQKMRFDEVTLRILYNGYYFENWRKKMVEG